MPTTLQWFNVDWSWEQLEDEERRAVRLHEAVLQADPASATVDWLVETLAAASARLPGRTLYAAAEDENDAGWWIEACDGRAEPWLVEEDRLPRYERLRDTPRTALFPETLCAADFRAAGIDKIARMLFYPRSVLDGLRAQAVRTDRSLSWLVQRAWAESSPRLAALAGPAALAALLAERGADGVTEDRYAQSLYFPAEVVDEIQSLAERLDCSPSRLMQLAWLLALERIAALPSAD